MFGEVDRLDERFASHSATAGEAVHRPRGGNATGPEADAMSQHPAMSPGKPLCTRGSQGLQACHEEDSETLDMVMQLVEDTNVMEIETVNALVKSAAAKDKQK